jgi:tol-pal system protein YbgF
MKSVTFRASLVAVALATMSGLAHAALFDDEEARRRIADTNIRIGEMQRQIEERLAAIELVTKGGGLLDLAGQLETLKGEIAKLRGQIEVLTYELGEAQKRQRDLYVDLDSRLRRLETAQMGTATQSPAPAGVPPAVPPLDPNAPRTSGDIPTPPPGGAPGSAATPPGPMASAPQGTVRSIDPIAEQRAYDAALDLFKRGDYSGAIAAFGSFVRTYPRTPLASSAQYWIGNAHFARRDFRSAITAQRTLIANYPDSSKVPDALLNIASAQSELGDTAGARKTLEELAAKHSQSDAGQKAKQRLSGR